MLVADRTSIFSIEIGAGDRAVVEPLPPGVHILENRSLRAPSPKVDRVRTLLDGIEHLEGDELVHRLQLVVADHEPPAGPSAAEEAGRLDVPVQVGAACVHTEEYGTRWSAVITVPATTAAVPTFRYAPGAPCTVPFVDATELFETRSDI
jgi:uncharacterized protein with NRDE domain